MQGNFTKSERTRIRQLADLAWDRALRRELRNIAVAIDEMESGQLSPFDVTDRIHEFHDGAARELYRQFAGSKPWLGVCRAHFDGILTDDEIVSAGGNIQEGIQEYSQSLAKLARERESSE